MLFIPAGGGPYHSHPHLPPFLHDEISGSCLCVCFLCYIHHHPIPACRSLCVMLPVSDLCSSRFMLMRECRLTANVCVSFPTRACVCAVWGEDRCWFGTAGAMCSCAHTPFLSFCFHCFDLTLTRTHTRARASNALDDGFVTRWTLVVVVVLCTLNWSASWVCLCYCVQHRHHNMTKKSSPQLTFPSEMFHSSVAPEGHHKAGQMDSNE